VDPNVATAGISLLSFAAMNGSGEIVDLLLAHGADPAWVSRTGWTAATFADANEFGELADRLVNAGAPASSSTAHGYTPLHRWARSGATMRVPRDLGAEDIDAVDAAGDTPLALAVQFRRMEAVVALLEAGANPNHMNDGWPILGTAVYEDSRPGPSTAFVEVLLAAGADVNPPGYPPLFCTVNQEWSSSTVMAQMVSAGADIDAVGGWERQTLLHRIAQIADADLVDAALDLWASIEARDGEGRTPLLAAADGANATAFIRLAERGADLRARDDSDHTVDVLIGDSAGSDQIQAFLDSRT
jgi:ankyrin repeat protein